MPDILYHYCTNAAALSIFQLKHLRLSPLALANDSGEGQFGRDQLRKAYFRLQNSANQETLDDALAMYNVFSVSFSKEADLLSQWRGYGDDGAGVAIGFKSTHLQAIADAYSVFFSFGPVCYGKHEVDRRIGETLIGDSDNSLNRLVTILYTSKAEFYREEQEWRLLFMDMAGIHDDKAQFQLDRRGAISPYLQAPFDHELDRMSIEEVILGPRNTSTVRDVETLALNAGFHSVKFRISSGSYRR